jgi:hypothetical protein
VRRTALVALLLALGCGRATTPPLDVTAKPDLGRIRRLAVAPVTASPTTGGDAAARAPSAVTAMLSQAAGRQSAWEIVDAAEVREAAASLPAADPESRAGSLAARIGADAALTATVSVYEERQGAKYGASQGAAVSLSVLLVPAGARQASWKASYAIRQQPLTYNLWDLWEMLRGGPRWLTADELAKIGVDEAVGRLAKAAAAP